MSDTPKCKSCGVAFEYHDGVSVLCANLTAARAQVERLQSLAMCVYCGHHGPKTEIVEHVKVCEKHPLHALKAEVEKLSKLNHDISIGEMIDKADEEAIGLLERPAELQFVRLASAFNALKVEVEKLKAERYSVEDIIAWRKYAWPLLEGRDLTDAFPSADDPCHGIAAFVAARRGQQ